MEFYCQKYLVKSTETSSFMISRNIFRISFSTLWAGRQGEKRPFPHSILAITQICFLKCTFPFHIYYFLTFLYSPFTSPSYTVWKCCNFSVTYIIQGKFTASVSLCRYLIQIKSISADFKEKVCQINSFTLAG